MYVFVNRRAMLEAAEREVREEAARHPDDPWTPDRDKRWAARHGGQADVATAEYTDAVLDARKRLRNELLMVRFEQVRKAAAYRDRCEARGETLPNRIHFVLAWANEPQKFLKLYYPEDDDETENLDEAVALLSQALA